MPELPTNSANRLQGTYEIDITGEIKYFFAAFESKEKIGSMTGKNFYVYLQSLSINPELENRIKTFLSSSPPTDSFNFEYIDEGIERKTLVLLARIRSQIHPDQDLFVIDIKPE